MPSAALSATGLVTHQIWGEPEVFSCYSSSSDDESNESNAQQDVSAQQTEGGRNAPKQLATTSGKQMSDSGSQYGDSAETRCTRPGESQVGIRDSASFRRVAPPRKQKTLSADMLKHISTCVRHDCESGSQSEDCADIQGSRSEAFRVLSRARSGSWQDASGVGKTICSSDSRPHVATTVPSESRNGFRSQDVADEEESCSELGDSVSSGEDPVITKQAIDRHGNVSRWAEAHDSGTCRPCVYVSTSGGCWRADDCNFCHLPHARPKRTRPCRRARTRCKQAMAYLQLAPLGLADKGYMLALQQQLFSEGPYLGTLIRGQQRRMRSQAWRTQSSYTQPNAARPEENSENSGASSSGQRGSGSGGQHSQMQPVVASQTTL